MGSVEGNADIAVSKSIPKDIASESSIFVARRIVSLES